MLIRWFLLSTIACGSPPRAPKATDEVLLGEPNTDVHEEPKKHPVPTTCSIQLTGQIIIVDDDQLKPDQAVAICKARQRAIVRVDEDVDLETWRRFRARLVAADVDVDVRSERGREPCESPVEKGCW